MNGGNHIVQLFPLRPQSYNLCLVLFSDHSDVDTVELLLLLLADSLEETSLTFELINYGSVRFDFF